MSFKIRNKRLWFKTSCYILCLTIFSHSPEIWGSSLSIKELNERLFSAIHSNNIALVRSSINAGANIKATNDEGLTAAGLAVEKGYFKIAHYILGIRNQKSRLKNNNTNSTPKDLNMTDLPVQSIKPTAKAIISSQPSSKDPMLLNEAPKAYKKWPKHIPNPFSPNSVPNKTIPIIGPIKESPVKSPISHPIINLKMKAQSSNKAPLKMNKTDIISKNSAPTPIQPLDKTTSKNMADKKAVKLPPKPRKVVQEEVEDSMNKTALEEAIDKVWSRINKIF